jgi:hypothetical protein
MSSPITVAPLSPSKWYESAFFIHILCKVDIKCCHQRAMPSGFFVLLRFYLRVDDVLIRINDTRLYYEKDNQYILREYTSKESKAKDLKV